MDRVAVLASGGLDSCVLLADLAQRAEVFPVNVEFGLSWEKAERAALESFLTALAPSPVKPLTVLEMPVRSIYGRHWSTTGEGFPDYDAPIDADYLPGRNVLLLGVTAVWCSLHAISQIAIGSLMHNPYADATPQFFTDYARLLSGALGQEIVVTAPYRGREKWELIREHAGLPLELTLTCVNPAMVAGYKLQNASPRVIHCGACIKCRERHDAFVQAGVTDRSRYAPPPG